jgi:uncharacterized tellurite resistance protein B-like protein
MIEPCNAIEEQWNILSDAAATHTGESIRFHKICEKYYGITWDSLPALIDNDRIIDTIGYGTDKLSFTEFDKLIRSAITEIRVNEDD